MKPWGKREASNTPNRKPDSMKHSLMTRIGALLSALVIFACFGVSALAEAPEPESIPPVVQSESAEEPVSTASGTEENSGTPVDESPSSSSGVNSSSSGDGVPPVSVPGENPESQSEVQSESQSASSSESQSEASESSPSSSEAEPAEEPAVVPQAAGNGAISGKVWLDENTNGVWDAKEDALQGIELKLFKADDLTTALANATTDENGAYSFEALEAGDYKVGVAAQKIDELERLIPMKMIQKGADNKFNADFSTDPIMATSESLTLAADGEVKDIDAGMRGKPKVSLLASYTINLASPSSGTGYTYNAGTKTITFSTAANTHDYTITGAGTTKVTAINFDASVNTTVTLSGVTLAGSITLGSGANITMLLTGDNTVFPGCLDATAATLTIDSSSGAGSTNGKLTVNPYDIQKAGITNTSGKVTINGGTLEIRGGEYSAGIGGSYGSRPGGTTIINGGLITVSADYGAGIGGGAPLQSSAAAAGSGGATTITGGTVNVTGGAGAAGIGGGRSFGGAGGYGGTTTITGGVVNARGNTGAAIGGGLGHTSGGGGGSVTITGGKVTAFGGSGSAAIGGALNGPGLGYLKIDKEATIWAVSIANADGANAREKIAIHSAVDNAGTGYYVNNKFVTTYAEQNSSLAYSRLEVAAASNPSVTLFTETYDMLPFSYAYTTGNAAPEDFMERLYKGSTYIGQIIREADNSNIIYSVNTLNGYDAHNASIIGNWPGALPVKLKKAHMVTYKGNNGKSEPDHHQFSVDLLNTDINIEPNTTTNFTPPTATPSYVFTSWNTEANGTGTKYTPGQLVTLSDNLILYAQWGPPAADVTISKTITGQFADLTKQFTFTATVWDKTNTALSAGTPFAWSVNTGTTSVNGGAAAASGTLTLQAGGKATFKLGNGQSITIEDIPSDGYIQIEEQTDALYSTSHTSGAGYSFSKTAGDTNPGNTDKQAMNANDLTVAYTNTRKYIPPTGVDSGSRAVALLGFTTALALAAVGATLWYIRRRRGVKEHE